MADNNNEAKPLSTSLTGRLPLVLFSMLAVLIIALLSSDLPQALADKNQPYTLTILHTNDLHAHDQSFQDRGKLVGGMARLGHLVRQLRKENANTIVADAGDIFQGTPFFTRYLGEVEVAMLNFIGYDIYTIGNHEFDSGAINLAKQLSNAKFDILNCNLDADALPDLKRLLKPSVIKEIGGEKVAFVGAITPDIETLSLTRDGVTLKHGPALTNEQGRDLSWLAPIQNEVERLDRQGIKKIILVTHCGLEVDKILAARMPQIDAIIGGHSHTRLASPVIVDHTNGTSTMIVQTGSYGRNLGKLDLVFDNEGKVVTAASRFKLYPINGDIPEDNDIKEYLDAKAVALQPLHDTIVSNASRDFDNNFRGMKADSALGNLICDSFFEASVLSGDRAEITFENRGGIRSRIEKGPVNLEKVEELLPFDNHLVFADVKGKHIKQTLEHSVSGATGGKFLDVHGMKFAYDGDKRAGDRIVFMQVFRDNKWQDIDLDGTYRIGMTDYSFKGGEGYEFSEAKNIKFTDLKLNVYFKDYLQKHPQISPHYGDRIAYVNGNIEEALRDGSFKKIDSPLADCGQIRLDVYQSPGLGVSTAYSGKAKHYHEEDELDSEENHPVKAYVLPLAKPDLIESDMTMTAFKRKFKGDTFKGYTVVVVRGTSVNESNHRSDDKHVTAISRPYSAEKLKELLK
jgi:5'-nucleotidase/UDP-sugar diphosphatase